MIFRGEQQALPRANLYTDPKKYPGALMPGQIFISYRRDDAAYVTGHINDRLCEEFGAESIFTDVDNIALGVDFRAVLDEKVGQCQILLAVIGSSWLSAKSQDGELRLQNPADFVRIEIESALKRKIPVIPLLVAGTIMPSKEHLPESLQDLSFRNGINIRPAPDFHADMDRLIHSLTKHLDSLSATTSKVELGYAVTQEAHASEQKREQSLGKTDSSGEQEKDKSDFTETNVIPEDDERARHQIELTELQVKKKRATIIFRSLAVAIVLIAAGVSWYIDFEYEAQYQAVVAALAETDAPAAGAELTVDAASQGRTEAAANSGRQLDAIAIDTLPVEEETIAGVVSGTNSISDIQGDAELVAETQGEAEADVGARLESDAATEVQGETKSIAEASDVTFAEEQPVAVAVAAAETTADTGSEADVEYQLKLDASTAFRAGISLAAIGNHEKAILKYDEAIGVIEDPAFVFKQRGASYNALGNYEAAIEDFGEAIRLNAEDANAFYNRGAAYRELGNHAAAIQDYDEAIRLNPEFAGAFSGRGSSHESLGNLEAAARDLAAAKEIRTRPLDDN
jgi:tetratricopeptide (TPR) repeat protein